jgi:hypothetical protein
MCLQETAIFHVRMTLKKDPTRFLASEAVKRSFFTTLRLGARVPHEAAVTADVKNNRRS